MLRAGQTIPEVSQLSGHSPAVLLAHYAGVVGSHRDQRLWGGWDDAWEWAAKEIDVP